MRTVAAGLALVAIVFEREDGGVTAGTDPDLLIHCRIHRRHTRRRRNRRGRRLPRSSHTVRHTVPCCCLLLQDLSTHGFSGASPAVPAPQAQAQGCPAASPEVPASGWQGPNRVCFLRVCADGRTHARRRWPRRPPACTAHARALPAGRRPGSHAQDLSSRHSTLPPSALATCVSPRWRLAWCCNEAGARQAGRSDAAWCGGTQCEAGRSGAATRGDVFRRVCESRCVVEFAPPAGLDHIR